MDLGTIYILEPVRYVYPFNTGVVVSKFLTFRTYDGDLAYGDRLVYSIDGNCSQIEFGKQGSTIMFIRTTEMKHNYNRL